MADPTAEFFSSLEERGPDLLPVKARGTIRFDLKGVDGGVNHWFVSVNRGNVLVSHENRQADCVVATTQELFDRLAIGEAQVVAAYNRNDVTVQGNLPLLLMFRRAFPSPPGTRDPRVRVRERLRRRDELQGRIRPDDRLRPASRVRPDDRLRPASRVRPDNRVRPGDRESRP
ncbi:SCP2 sterol-binding domain-containing protein [Plantactinospora solaniradicis]|uniref:SCP2 sterol-binding domain-containing protein n=1 Tax=Plantactinospora solaniradicis TaxID=1723736 RepID=A0ABW1KPI1_9ACTN